MNSSKKISAPAQGLHFESAQGLHCAKAQGTIEYLVIIAVVIVIALVVVGLLTGIFQNQFSVVNPAVDNIGQSISSEGISVYEFVQDVEGDGLVNFTNNSNDTITLRKIYVGGAPSVFNTPVASLDSRLFYLSDLNLSCPCLAGEASRVCSVVVEYATPDGLVKTISGNMTSTCVSNTTPANPGSVAGLGDGTLLSPWIINSCLELQAVNERLDGNYALGADINCSASSSWNSGTGFSPIGTLASSFAGSFDGKGYSVSGVKIVRSGTNYVGLFGRTLSSASILNLDLIDANIIGSEVVGGLIGSNNGSVSNVSVSGSVSAGRYTGGLAGINAGYLTASSSSVSVSGANYTGGLVGYNMNSGGTILGHVIRCSSTGSVLAAQNSIAVGGLVGNNFGEITNSYARGSVTSSDAMAVGGIAGNHNTPATLTNSYSTGLVTCTGGSCSSVGGLVGLNWSATTTSSYWDVNTSNQSSSGSGIGKTTAEMKQAATYSGWDFTNTWQISEGLAYPSLK